MYSTSDSNREEELKINKHKKKQQKASWEQNRELRAELLNERQTRNQQNIRKNFNNLCFVNLSSFFLLIIFLDGKCLLKEGGRIRIVKKRAMRTM